MNNSILNLVRQYAQGAIVNNPEIPEEKNNSAIESVSEGIFNGLKNEAAGGGLGQILNMFKPSGNVSNSLSANVENSVVDSLMDKVGIKNETARKVADSIVPMVLKSLSNLGRNPSGSAGGLNVQSILNSLTDGKTNDIDIQGLLNKGLGGEDGKFDLNDVMNLANGKNGNNGSDNILNELGNLMGKK